MALHPISNERLLLASHEFGVPFRWSPRAASTRRIRARCRRLRPMAHSAAGTAAAAQRVDLGADAWESIFGFITSPAESPAESADEDGSKLHHKNVYGIDKPFGKEEKREDGNYEMSWFMSKEENLSADGFYHPFVPTPGPLRYRAISPNKESSYVGLRFALPFTKHVAASDAAEAPWLSESFIRHRNQRWSITPNYPAADPQLKMVLQIREFSTGGTFDDQADVDFQTLPLIKPALPQLSPDPAEWLPPKAHQGSRSTLTFSTDGDVAKQTGQPCQWTPPDPALPGHRLCLLADQCYAFVPGVLPMKASVSGDDVKIEVGVLTADGTFKRNIACYDARTGFVRAVHHEIFAEQ